MENNEWQTMTEYETDRLFAAIAFADRIHKIKLPETTESQKIDFACELKQLCDKYPDVWKVFGSRTIIEVYCMFSENEEQIKKAQICLWKQTP